MVPIEPENKKDLFIENNSDPFKNTSNNSYKETDGTDLSVDMPAPGDISEKENGQLDSGDIEKAMEDPADFMLNVDSPDEECSEPDVPDDFLDECDTQVSTSNITNDDDAKSGIKETNDDKKDSGQSHDKKNNQSVPNDQNNFSRTRQKVSMEPDNLIDTGMIVDSVFSEKKMSENKTLDDEKVEHGKPDSGNDSVKHDEHPQRPDRVINRPANTSSRSDSTTHKGEGLHNNDKYIYYLDTNTLRVYSIDKEKTTEGIVDKKEAIRIAINNRPLMKRLPTTKPIKRQKLQSLMRRK